MTSKLIVSVMLAAFNVQVSDLDHNVLFNPQGIAEQRTGLTPAVLSAEHLAPVPIMPAPIVGSD